MKRKKIKKQLLMELKEFEKNGCQICLEGAPRMRQEIAAACLREENDYMRDYISDEQERIQKVDFIRVK